MAEYDGDKTQEATPHRRQQARERGHVVKSQDLASAVLLLVGLLAILMLGSRPVEYLGGFSKQQLGGEAWLSVDPDFVVAQWNRTVFAIGRSVLPILGAVLVAGVAVHFVQAGFLFLPEKLAPDIGRLDPSQGLGRMFSLSNVARLGFGLLKMAVIVSVAGVVLCGQRDKVLGMTGMAVPEIAALLVQFLLWTAMKIAAALLVLAILDYGFQRWKFERDLRMTPQEVREEMKNLEGNRQVIARRKQVQRQLAGQRLAQAVPKADVVVTSPAELAVALRYAPATADAPIVVAKGAGAMAAQIRQLALEHGVPLVEMGPLAQSLHRNVEINHAIPADQYAPVAEVLACARGSVGETARQHTAQRLA